VVAASLTIAALHSEMARTISSRLAQRKARPTGWTGSEIGRSPGGGSFKNRCGDEGRTARGRQM